MEIYLLFETRDYCRILWSRNLDPRDLPNKYPHSLEDLTEWGVMQSMNMSKISQMQQFFRWQPHLPFVPVHLPYTEFVEQYWYQYDMLPIVEAGPSEWTLNNEVAQSWKSHIQTFSLILQTWSSNLAKAPMTITWVPDIHDYQIKHFFPTPK